jgi:hypothetical protein
MINLGKTFSAEGIQYLSKKITDTISRFPFTVAASLFSSILAIVLISYTPKTDYHIKTLLCGYLAIPLFFSIEAFNERKYSNRWFSIAAGIVFMVIFWFFFEIENPPELSRKNFVVFLVLNLCFHLLAAVAPYLQKGDVAAFWQYNKTLFLSFLHAALYSITLSGGLCLALLAVTKLFDLSIDPALYSKIFIFINSFGNSLLFLGKLPQLTQIDSPENSYPSGLKYFAQYVLLPLVAIYVLILLAYEFKIIAQWSLPKGWVSVLVLASAIFGILAFLLLYPLRQSNRWVASFTKAYYWLLLPLIMLMLVAIYVRIKNYGVTEPRYYIAALAVWLLGIAAYFVLSRADNIKVIPMSLIVIGLLSVFGPLSSFQVSSRNQSTRLSNTLKTNNLLKNGKIFFPKNTKLSNTDLNIVNAALDYLSFFNPDALKPLLADSTQKKLTDNNPYKRKEAVFDDTKIPRYVSEDYERGSTQSYYLKEQQPFEPIYKADYLMHISSGASDTDSLENSLLRIKPDALKNYQYTIELDGQVVVFDLSALKNLQKNEITTQQATFLWQNKKWQLRLLLNQVQITQTETKKLEYLDGKLFFTKR